MVSMSVSTDRNAAERCHRLSHPRGALLATSILDRPRARISHLLARRTITTFPRDRSCTTGALPARLRLLARERPRPLPGPSLAPNSTVPYARTLEPAS